MSTCAGPSHSSLSFDNNGAAPSLCRGHRLKRTKRILLDRVNVSAASPSLLTGRPARPVAHHSKRIPRFGPARDGEANRRGLACCELPLRFQSVIPQRHPRRTALQLAAANGRRERGTHMPVGWVRAGVREHDSSPLE